MSHISLPRLKKIINEELRRYYLFEGEKEKVALQHALEASKCLDAIEKYLEVATEHAKSALGSSIESVQKTLRDITDKPQSYADPIASDFEGEEAPVEDIETGKVIKPTVKSSEDDTDLEDIL